MINSKHNLDFPVLDDDSAAALYEFLKSGMDAFEFHYGAQLNAYYAEMYNNNLPEDQQNYEDKIPF